MSLSKKEISRCEKCGVVVFAGAALSSSNLPT
jgi:hypothetical protein